MEWENYYKFVEIKLGLMNTLVIVHLSSGNKGKAALCDTSIQKPGAEHLLCAKNAVTELSRR
jgi:hypothetical protein